MVMNGVFCALLLLGVMYAAATGQADAAQRALLSGGTQAVELCLSLAGAYAFFGGLMGLVRESGLAAGLAAALRKPLFRLLRFELGEEAALSDICLNLSADMLGMGNAATPYGIEAMRLMQKNNPKPNIATYEMCVFLCINASCLELLPSGLIALRQACGSTAPASIVLPTFLSSACATIVAVLCCKLLPQA